MNYDHHVQLMAFEDIDVAFQTNGSGKNVVMIHGLGQDHGIWSEVQAGLQHFSTFAYDIRGHGGTSLGAADGTIDQLGHDLIAFLEFVGPATCVGFSLGGSIGLWAASERPDLFEGVIVVATSSVVGSSAVAAMEDRITVVEKDEQGEVRRLLFDDTVAQLATSDVSADTLTDARMRAIGDARGYVNGARAICGIHSQPLNSRLDQITVRTLIVSGELDTWCPRRAAEIMMEHLQNASFLELPGVGHLVTDIAPFQLVEIMRNWMEAEGSK